MGKTKCCRRVDQHSFNYKTYNLCEFMPNSVVQDQPKYYVDMPIIFTITNLELLSLT
jgi:hypothetical protein